MKTVTIIGYGRFGPTLHKLLDDSFKTTIYTRHPVSGVKTTQSAVDAYKSEVIFFAVPISAFEHVIRTHKKYFRPGHVLIDVLSVKIHPQKVLSKYLRNLKGIQAILTHPMFGPDSSKNGFENLPLIMNRFKSDEKNYDFWKEYFESKKLRIIEMAPEEHDKLAARSQGLTHFIGRLLEKMKFNGTPIDSLGTKKLLEVMEQTCNDTWELFRDLQTYNPYTRNMRLRLERAYDVLYEQLLPTRVNPKYYVYGIQGGVGSFNEQALTEYIAKMKVKKYKVKYLYTTAKVLRNLHEGNIDFGLFAITNSTGGLVEESIPSLAHYPATIVDDFQILIRHFLIIRRDVDVSKVTTIMAHPQSLKQCENTLKKNHPKLKLESGVGDLVDTAKAAEYLAAGKLPKNTAILGSEILASKYNFKIIDRDLQDQKDNYTRFLLVKR